MTTEDHTDDWALDVPFERIKKRRRTGVVKATDRAAPRMIFAYTTPNGRLCGIIDAENLDDAWVIATGWGDQTDIREKIAAGWRLSPAMLEWETTT